MILLRRLRLGNCEDADLLLRELCTGGLEGCV